MAEDDFLDVDLKRNEIKQVFKEALRELFKEKYVFDPDPEKRLIDVEHVGSYPNFTCLLHDAIREGVKDYLEGIDWQPAGGRDRESSP